MGNKILQEYYNTIQTIDNAERDAQAVSLVLKYQKDPDITERERNQLYKQLMKLFVKIYKYVYAKYKVSISADDFHFAYYRTFDYVLRKYDHSRATVNIAALVSKKLTCNTLDILRAQKKQNAKWETAVADSTTMYDDISHQEEDQYGNPDEEIY